MGPGEVQGPLVKMEATNNSHGGSSVLKDKTGCIEVVVEGHKSEQIILIIKNQLTKLESCTSESGGGGVQGVRTPPPLKNKRVQPKVQNYFLTVVLNLQEMHSIFTKINFFPGGHAPLPP